MIPHGKKLLIATLIGLLFLAASIRDGQGELVRDKVLRVIDGDTLEISGGTRVRLLGIDAPEKGEFLSEKATERLRELTLSGEITLEMCADRDLYGRFLATIRVERANINSILLKEGLALPMLIPPCGIPVVVDVLKSAGQGALAGKGIYSLSGYEIISPVEAGNHINEQAIVRGTILEIHKGSKVWHLNFGSDWRTDFSVVIFRDGQKRFSDLRIDPADLVGSEVLVIGKVKRYNGPEITVRGPDQIIPLEGMIIQDSRFKIQEDDQKSDRK
jgi:hypothetical protein